MPDPRSDPTRTKTLRNKFTREIRKRINEFRKKLNTLLVDRDAFGLGTPTSFTDTQIFSFLSDPQKLEEFEKWLEENLEPTLIPGTDKYWEAFIEEGYRKGAGRIWRDTNRHKEVLTATPFSSGTFVGREVQFVQLMLGAPESLEKLQTLVSRTFTDLQGVTDQIAVELRRELAEGLVAGVNPRVIARSIADNVFGRNKVKNSKQRRKVYARAERIARTEIIRAHAEGQLDALERMGIEEVGVAVEWLTAGDRRVCPQCRKLSGIVLKVKEAHGMIPLHPS